MSVRVMSLVFRESESTGAARLVLLALADVASDAGEVTAYARSYSTLAVKAKVNESTVRKAIRTLEELGEVTVLSVGTGRAKNNYQIHLPTLGVDLDDQMHTQGAPTEYPITPSPSGRTSSSKRPRSDPDDAFEAWWVTFPKRDGVTRGDKQKAWAAWDRLAPETQAMVVRATPHYEATIRDPRYVMDAVRFITSKRYVDLQEPPKVTAKMSPEEAAKAKIKARGGA